MWSKFFDILRKVFSHPKTFSANVVGGKGSEFVCKFVSEIICQGLG